MAASGKKLFPGIQFSKGDITLEHGQKSLPPQGSSQPGLGSPLSETLSRQNKPAVTENISGSGACWFSVFLKGKGRSWWNCLLHGPQLCLQDHSHRGGKIRPSTQGIHLKHSPKKPEWPWTLHNFSSTSKIKYIQGFLPRRRSLDKKVLLVITPHVQKQLHSLRQHKDTSRRNLGNVLFCVVYE